MIARGNIGAIFQRSRDEEAIESVRRLKAKKRKKDKKSILCSQHVSLARLGPVVQCCCCCCGWLDYVNMYKTTTHTHRLIIKVVKERWGALPAEFWMRPPINLSVGLNNVHRSWVAVYMPTRHTGALHRDDASIHFLVHTHTRIETCFQLVMSNTWATYSPV